METLHNKSKLSKTAETAMNGLHFVAKRLKGGAWADLAELSVAQTVEAEVIPFPSTLALRTPPELGWDYTPPAA